jgi:hypothetical protein
MYVLFLSTKTLKVDILDDDDDDVDIEASLRGYFRKLT